MTPAQVSALLNEQDRLEAALEYRLRVVLLWAGVALPEADEPKLATPEGEVGPREKLDRDGSWRPGMPSSAKAALQGASEKRGRTETTEPTVALVSTQTGYTTRPKSPAQDRTNALGQDRRHEDSSEPSSANPTAQSAAQSVRPPPRARLAEVLARSTRQPARAEFNPATAPRPAQAVTAASIETGATPQATGRTPADWSMENAPGVMVSADPGRPVASSVPRPVAMIERTASQQTTGPAATTAPVGREASLRGPSQAEYIWPGTSTARVRMPEPPAKENWPDGVVAPSTEPVARTERADPFTESALEEAMADALERAALEAGIDLT